MRLRAAATDQSALNLIYLFGYSGQGQLRIFGPSNEKYHVRGGNDQIVTQLAARLSGSITTGAEGIALAHTGLVSSALGSATHIFPFPCR